MSLLNKKQLEVLAAARMELIYQTSSALEQLDMPPDPNQLTDQQLVEWLQICNILYRAGERLISDIEYDHTYLAELEKRQPDHPYLNTVEPESVLIGKTVPLPEPMLSTEKAYTRSSIERWLSRLHKAAEECGIDSSSILIRATPKLDGYAAYDDGNLLYTRGDGRKGTDISRVFDRGLSVGGNGQRGQGPGEIVISQTYFSTHLAEYFENSRNFQASIIKEKSLEAHTLAAIQQGAAVFFPFSQLPDWIGSTEQLLVEFEFIVESLLTSVDYDVDGVIFELYDNDLIKKHLGATRHHHRWQIAYKSNLETAEVEVLAVTPQTSRSGRVNPVAELVPTKLSGAVISRATAHHYGMVKHLGIGPGTIIELTRSGLVIPKIERVIIPKTPQIPVCCPSCNSPLVWDADYLYCLNIGQCPAQIEHTIEHFFKTLANNDGFGEKTIAKLCASGITTVAAIYQLDDAQLQTLGFAEKTRQNLLTQLQRSRIEPIEDWRFLSAFGIHRMGLGNCERLLQHHRLSELFQLTIADMVNIEGFAEKTAAVVMDSLASLQSDFMQIYQLGFNIIETSVSREQQPNHPVSGKTLVFTGTMQHGNREQMTREAKRLGAKVANAVTGKTDYLIAGMDVGTTKLAAAEKKGVKILSEAEYLTMISDN